MNDFYKLIKYVSFFLCFYNQTLIAQPTISSFNPASGLVGTTVIITGSNFDPTTINNVVYFGAVKAAVTAASTNSLTVIVPEGATYQPVTVTTNGLTAYSASPFNVTFAGGGFVNPGSFPSKSDSIPLNASYGPYGLTVSDFDGDGKSDVAVIDTANGFSLYKNSSTRRKISFVSVIKYRSSASPFNIVAGDLDGDGRTDLAVTNYVANNFSVFKNISVNGTISFTTIGSYQSSGNPTEIFISDFNADGKPDIITQNLRTIIIFKNTSSNGNMSFAISTEYPAIAFNDGLNGFAVNDIDGDGKPDIAVSGNNRIYILRNTSTGGLISFAPRTEMFTNNTDISFLSDMNGDGKPDLALLNSTNISILKNTATSGTISFASPVDFIRGSAGAATVLSDIDGDGRPDIVMSEMDSNRVSILRNNGTDGIISFDGKINVYTGNRPWFTVAADIDGDGKPDILTSNLITPLPSIGVLRNKTGEPQLVPSGVNPVSGDIETKVTVDPAVQTYNGNPYVQRHYDIEPVNNPSTSTATLTLYYTQGDFNNYNAHPNHGIDLPTGPTDNNGKTALRVTQHHGFSTSSLPGSYSGSVVQIDPDDNNILWNAINQRWEVTFDVTGFSGFFISSSANSTLPLTLLSFSASQSGLNYVLQWVTTNEVNVNFFELQRSDNGADFTPVIHVKAAGSINSSKEYQYVNVLGGAPVYYYRLKIVDFEGGFKLSKVVSVSSTDPKSPLAIYPNPAKDYLQVNHPTVVSKAQLTLMDMTGKIVKKIDLKRNILHTRVMLNGLLNGPYKIVWSDGKKTLSQILIIDGNVK